MNPQRLAVVACLLACACSCGVKDGKPGRLYPVPREGKWGFINNTGALVVEPQFDAVCECSEGLAAVRVGARWGYVNSAGETVIPPQFGLAGLFSEGLAPVSQGMYWGYIDTTGRIAIQPRFLAAGPFVKGLARAASGSGYILIDRTGTAVSGPYRRIDDFAEGLAAVALRDGRQTMAGYVDESGRVAISLRFSYAGGFSKGRAVVKIGDKWAHIDRTGAVLAEFDQPPHEDDAWWLGPGEKPANTEVELDAATRTALEVERARSSIRDDGLAPVFVDGKMGYVDRQGSFVWKLTPIPPRRDECASSDEYDVYAEVIAASDGDPAYLMGRTEIYSDFSPFGEPRFALEEARSQLQGLEVSALDDLMRKPECELEDRFGLPPGRVVLVDKFPSWEALREKHPRFEDGMPAVVELSRVGFNSQRTQALVYVSALTGPLAGSGDYMLLARTGDGWRVVSSWMIWIA